MTRPPPPFRSKLLSWSLVALSLGAAAGSADGQQEPGSAPAGSPAVRAAPPAAGTGAEHRADDLLDAWRDHIRPCESERAWERIGWLASFADGLRAAHAEGKPLLLWMMNGHPLGCT